MSSTRLPGKVLLPFRGTTVLQYLYERCISIEGITKVVILTSDMSDDDAIKDVCELSNIPFFRGSLLNVLERFQKASQSFCNPNDFVIRLCADSPLIDRSLLQAFTNDVSSNYSFFSTRYLKNGVFISTTGKGNNIDAVTVSALAKLKGINELIREHIIYGFDYSDGFRLFKSSQKFDENNCIDTVDDYRRLSLC